MGEKDVHLHDASKTLSLPHPLVPQSKRSILLFSGFDTYLYPQQIENKNYLCCFKDQNNGKL